MASLNLSTDGPSISKSYQFVVNAPPPSGPAADSPTYGQWAVFSVSAPLVNIFQQNSAGKESTLKVQTTGEGELIDLIDEFSEGKVQFAYVKIKDPNTGLPKNVLIAWCGEGVPERTKGYFTSHLAVISKFLHGYHVQITARADGDLTPEGIIQKVADSSGSKYSSSTSGPPATAAAPPPPIASKPVFTPTRTGGGVNKPTPSTNIRKTAAPNQESVDDDGWGADAPPITRTQLEKVEPAYRPTKVDLQHLRSGQQSVSEPRDGSAPEDRDVVKGGYQPVGKVDIAALRRQARETGELKEDRPEPVKGSYEPVGKVDIAAIRSRAQKPDDYGVAPGEQTRPQDPDAPSATPEPSTISFSPSERLTSLPKPKVSNKFAANPAFMGTKPPLPTEPAAKAASTTPVIGSASRTFADAGGKTPAQQWAEKKARERGHNVTPASSTPTGPESPIQSQFSGQGEWKSSYTGKNWAPVQVTHTGKSAGSNLAQQHTGSAVDEYPEGENQNRQGVSALRNQFSRGAPRGPPSFEDNVAKAPSTARTVPIPGLSSGPTEPEREHDAQQVFPAPPQQPRSPTPPAPQVRDSSPIRVAMPVGRGVADAHDEQHSSPAAMPVQNLQQTVPDENNLEETPHDVGRAAAEATVDHIQQGGAVRAIAQYDYEKAEDNEIELKEGEYITDIETVDRDWWLGVNSSGERGLFPSNYVDVVEDDHHQQLATSATEPEPYVPEPAAEEPAPPAPRPTATTNARTASALYDYEAAEDNELSFPEGAKIANIEFPDDDWWLGEYHGQTGLFPSNYVQLDE